MRISPEDAVLQSVSDSSRLVPVFERFRSGSEIYVKAHNRFLELV